MLNRVLQALGDSDDFAPRVGSTRQPRLSAAVSSWVRMIDRNQAFQDWFATARLLSLDPRILHARGETAQSGGGRLARSDREALEEIFSQHTGGAAVVLGKKFCNSLLVTCARVDGDLRVTGLYLSTLRGPGDADDEAYSPGINPPTLPPAVAKLTKLRQLKFSPLGVMQPESAVTGEDVCAWLQSIPGLEVLQTAMMLPPQCRLPQLKSLVVIGIAAVDELTSTETETGVFQSVADLVYRSIQPGELEFVCNSPMLQFFEVGRAVGLPECMAANTELLRVDLRGGRLRGPLPAGAARWTKLVDFVAFEQGQRWCPASGRPASADGAFDCKVNYHAKATWEEDEINEPLWHCPHDGWVVPFDDPANPWWSWQNLERFWVDVNFLHGRIPNELPDRWPRLRTLDLYSNELTGEVPATLCKLTQLRTLQLQDNRLSGEFPFEAFFSKCPSAPQRLSKVTTLELAMNPNLTGCVRRETLQAGARYLEHMTTGYTQIRLTDNDEHCDLSGEHSERHRYSQPPP